MSHCHYQQGFEKPSERLERAKKICLGCGVSIDSLKKYERRLLCSDSSKEVRSAWEVTFSRKLDDCGKKANLEELVGSETNPEYVCRKCFADYEKLVRLQNQLLQKVEVAVSKMPAFSQTQDLSVKLGRKRKRPDSARIAGPCKWPLFAPQEGTSPAVVVSVQIDVMQVII